MWDEEDGLFYDVLRLPGGRADIRDRATTVSMHLLRRLLRGEARKPLPGPGADSVSAAAPS